MDIIDYITEINIYIKLINPIINFPHFIFHLNIQLISLSTVEIDFHFTNQYY